jgi:hypothetical protein
MLHQSQGGGNPVVTLILCQVFALVLGARSTDPKTATATYPGLTPLANVVRTCGACLSRFAGIGFRARQACAWRGLPLG